MESRINPALLGKINGRRVLDLLQKRGPLSRASVTRLSGISAPTVSKAVDALLRTRLVEEGDAASNGVGRPARVVRLAAESARVLGVTFDKDSCSIAPSGLDGRVREELRSDFPTPRRYEALLDAVARRALPHLRNRRLPILGLGISMPGLLNRREGKGVFSPNLHLTDGRAPGKDLSRRLGVECVVRQESHALCLGEGAYGLAKDLDDFAMLDVSTGLGLGVWSGGRLLEGARGLAGELGHMTIEPGGHRCGCGNRGCLETLATDSALARRVSRRLGRKVAIEEALRRSGPRDLEETSGHLAVAIGAVINIFNPSTLFVHGRLFDARPGLFEKLRRQVRHRTLTASLSDCRIVRAQGSKLQGAVAGIVRHLFDAVAPRLPWEDVPISPRAV